MIGFKKRKCFLVALVFFGFLVLIPRVLAEKSEIRVGDKIPNFVLEDAYEKRYELEKMKGKVIILIMGSKTTQEDINRWAEVLQQTFSNNDSLEIFFVAEMRNIPFFVSKNFVRKKVKEKLRKDNFPLTTLLDWDQKVNKLLDADRDETDIFAIAPDGVLVSHQVGTYSEEKFRLLRNKIVEILDSDNLKEKKSKEEKE